jgi:hypothetical protein
MSKPKLTPREERLAYDRERKRIERARKLATDPDSYHAKQREHMRKLRERKKREMAIKLRAKPVKLGNIFNGK